jgi:hypothetical protein
MGKEVVAAQFIALNLYPNLPERTRDKPPMSGDLIVGPQEYETGLRTVMFGHITRVRKKVECFYFYVWKIIYRGTYADLRTCGNKV